SHAIAYAQKKKMPPELLEFQMLYGMAEPIKRGLVEMGYRVRDYAPVGELLPGMAYLVRRLLENTSNESFLKQKFSDSMDTKLLLREPSKEGPEPDFVKPEFFKNASNLDFANRKTWSAFKETMNRLELPIK